MLNNKILKIKFFTIIKAIYVVFLFSWLRSVNGCGFSSGLSWDSRVITADSEITSSRDHGLISTPLFVFTVRLYIPCLSNVDLGMAGYRLWNKIVEKLNNRFWEHLWVSSLEMPISSARFHANDQFWNAEILKELRRVLWLGCRYKSDLCKCTA